MSALGEYAPLVVAIPFSAISFLLGVWAERRFASHAQLPIHFNFRLQADRLASRSVAIWVLPLIFSTTLLGIGLLSALAPREMLNGDPMFGIVFAGCLCVAAHIFVLWLTARWASDKV